MIKKSDLTYVIDIQNQLLKIEKDEIKRDLYDILPTSLNSHALIISGVRRCGKSTLIKQMIVGDEKNTFFINFDTPKLYNFDINDFEILDQIIKEKQVKKLFFDEIQVVKGWELYIRQKLDENFQIVITGSNATLLSKELGTKLTGRHLNKELYPFSYSEFLKYKKTNAGIKSFSNYFKNGGFPEYIKQKNPDILVSLFEDILFRDIAVRYGVRDVKSLQRLFLYLVANVGSPVTASKLKSILGIKSTATVLDYFSYFEQSWLLRLLPKFSWSYRAQLVNPRKAYIIDNGLINAITPSFTKNDGRKLENIIYWFLLQHKTQLFYFNEDNHECDFIVFKNNSVKSLIQVCYELNHSNREREQQGLIAAMNFFNLQTGYIITMDQNDIMKIKDKQIIILPAYEYMLNQSVIEI